MPETRSYEAKDLLCRACDEWFVFTVKEQRFYAQQGFPPPKRCPSCRAEKRQRYQQRERFDSTSWGLWIFSRGGFGFFWPQPVRNLMQS